MPYAALVLALVLTALFAQPPGASARRTSRRGEDDDRYDNEEASDDDDEDTVTSDDPTTSATAVAPPLAPPSATPVSVPVKASPSALLSKARGRASAAAQDDDSTDDSDKDDAEVERLKAQEKAERAELSKAEAALDVNLVKQTRAKAKLADLNDPGSETASSKEIAQAVKDINNETQSQALGTVLGKMWTEMRMYAGPFYVEHLEKQLKTLGAEETSLNKKERHLRASLKKTRKDLAKALDGEDAEEENDDDEEKDAKDDDDEKDAKDDDDEKGAKEEKAKPAPESAAAKKDAKKLVGRETTRMWLALWFAGMVALVGVTFVVARRQQ